MSKIVSIKLNDDVYKKIALLAKFDNRPISNFIETMTLAHIEELNFVDDIEMQEIQDNPKLQKSLKRGLKDMKSLQGRFV